MADYNDRQRESKLTSGRGRLGGQQERFPGWPATLVGSSLALGLLVAGPGWANISPQEQIRFTPTLSPANPSYLRGTLPPFLSTDKDKAGVEERVVPATEEVLFIDQGVSAYQVLANSLARAVEVVFIAPDVDGVSVISEHLQGRKDLQGIHIVSHGGPGRLYLGNQLLTAAELTRRKQELRIWSRALGPDGDVLLYGCEVAQGNEGIRFVNRLAHTLTTGLSASDDPTGSPVLGGDWNLEYRHDVETESIFTASVTDDFHALLAPGQVIAGDGSGGGGGGADANQKGGNGGHAGSWNDTINGTPDDDVLFGDGSGGGGGGRSDSFFSSNGSAGIGGSAADTLNGGAGADIIFGDGFNGSGRSAGFGNVNGGTGGYGSTKYGDPTDGQAGFGGALGGSRGFNSKYSSTPPGNGANGDNGQVVIADSGGAIHAAAMSRIGSGWFSNRPGGSGADVLDGGPGSDELFGMGGSNIFAVESDDGISGVDVDTIHDWNSGAGNRIDLRTGGTTIAIPLFSIIADQVAAGTDRSIVHSDSDGSNPVTVVVKGIDRDLVLADFVVGPNDPPVLGGTFTTDGQVDDNAVIAPFADVSVTDPEYYNIQIAITYPAADGVLTGAGLSGVAGNYSLAGADPVTAATLLQALEFTPTPNQVVVGSTVVTNFTLTPFDGLAYGTSDGSTQVTATSVDDAPAFKGVPSISGLTLVGQTLSLDNTGTIDPDIGDTVTLSYQWLADDTEIAGAVSSSYTLTPSEAHSWISCRLTATDSYGISSTPVETNAVYIANTDPVITTTPVITGVPAVGSTLSLSGAGASDADGDPVIFSYQWRADGTNITGATDAALRLTSSAAHKHITCVLRAHDGRGGMGGPITTSGVLVANGAPVFTSTPVITGTAKVDRVLSLDRLETDDPDGDPVTLSYQWQADALDIDGATSPAFFLTITERKKSITCIITASDGYGGETPFTTAGVVVEGFPWHQLLPIILREKGSQEEPPIY